MKGVMEHYGGKIILLVTKVKRMLNLLSDGNTPKQENSFDKALKHAERVRAYRKSVANEIETISSTNEFWNKIRKLGPRYNNNIPMEALNEDGTILTTERDVLERWRTDFENLYNGSPSDDFDNDHFNFVKSK